MICEDIRMGLSPYIAILVLITIYLFIVIVKNKKYISLFFLIIPLSIVYQPIKYITYSIKYENKLNQLQAKDINSISFYKVKYCDLSEDKKKLIKIDKEDELDVFLNDYFRDLRINIQKTWTTLKDSNVNDSESKKFLEKYFDKSVLEKEKLWRMLFMMEIKRKNSETLHICVNYAEILYKSPSKIVFPVDFGKKEKYKSVAVSSKLKKFLKTLKLSKEL